MKRLFLTAIIFAALFVAGGQCFGILVMDVPLDDWAESPVIRNTKGFDGTFWETPKSATRDTIADSWSGRHGRALYFDGVNNMVTLDDNAAMLNVLTEGTITLWFNNQSGHSGSQTLFSCNDDTDTNSYFTIYYNHTRDGISMWCMEGGVIVLDGYIPGDLYVDDEWHFLVYTSDSSGHAMYIDGVLQPLTYDTTGDASTPATQKGGKK